MRSDRRAAFLAAIAALVALGLAACLGSVDRNYVSADGGSEGSSAMGDDATVDAPAESSPGTDAGGAQDADAMAVQETAPPDAGPPIDASPPDDAQPEVGTGQTFSCNGQTVTSCAGCQGNPLECVYCANDGGHPGVCGPAGMYCTGSAPPNAAVCNCPGGNAGQCPAAFQVCTYIGGAFYCQTCGEMGSDMEPCKDGGHCSGMPPTCH